MEITGGRLRLPFCDRRENIVTGNIRYMAYFRAFQEKRQKSYTTKKSVLEKLKELKNKEFIMQIPIREEHES